MALNGRLPASDLAVIAGGRLVRPYALRWNLANAAVRRAGLATVLPDGPMSSYRTFAEQVFLRHWWCQRGKCKNAAIPGTSNHGWGRAVDTNRRATIQAHGARYGVRFPTDAPWESWHTLVHLDAVRVPRPKADDLVLRWRQHSFAVRTLQRLLWRAGYWPKGRKPSRYFGWRTRKCVIAFQRKHRLKPDGVVGPATWRALRRAAHGRH